jgi:hypothetical protein
LSASPNGSSISSPRASSPKNVYATIATTKGVMKPSESTRPKGSRKQYRLVARRPCRDDRRCVEVVLKEKGEQLLQRLARLHKDQLIELEPVFRFPVL